jgi:hypothetical protein
MQETGHNSTMQLFRKTDEKRPEAIVRAVRERRRITIRPADEADAGAIRRLSALSTRPVPPGPLTVAETDDGVVAVVGHGHALVDPFRATGDLIELLALRAAQLEAA